MTKHLLAAGLLLSIACTGSEPRPAAADLGMPEDRMPIVERLIETPPPLPFHPRSLYRTEGERRWDFSAEPDSPGSRWKAPLSDLEDRRIAAGRQVRASREYQTIERAVHFDSSRFDAFELSTGRTKGAAFTLQWAGLGERFSSERSLRVASGDIERHQFQSAIFDLRGHPAWRGRIRKLRIAIGAPAQQRILLRELVANRATTDPEALASALGRPWLVDLAGDVRSAWLAVPDLPIERSVAALPPGARLRGSWSIPQGYPPGTLVEISWQPEGGPSEVLSEHPLGEGETDSWQPFEIDLDRWQGKGGKVSFRLTGAPRDVVDAAGPAAWGSPEIWTAEAPRRPPNVVLISIDTLRADRLSTYGYRLPTSPRLDAWAARSGVVFEYAIAQAPWTLPSHSSMLTGLDPFRHGTNHDAPLAAGIETLAEALRRGGYRTRAVTAGRFLTPQYGTAQGFDRFQYFAPDSPEQRPLELETNLERAVDALDEMAGEPFFLFFHTYETHAPYRPRQPWFERLHGQPPPRPDELRPPDNDDDPDPAARRDQPFGVPRLRQQGGEEVTAAASDLYDAGIAYMDNLVGQLLDRVDDLGPTVVVFTSDHGELFGEHGLAGHDSLYEENLRVPLIIAAPDGLGAGDRVVDQVRSVDIVATILDLVGIRPSQDLDGRTLRPYLEGRRPADSPRAWAYASRTNRGFGFRQRNRLKVIYDNSVWSPTAGKAKAFDLRKDPREEHPLPAPPEALELMRQRFEALPGLWLTLENPTQRIFTLDIQGPLVTPASFKSVALGNANMSQPEAERARIALPGSGRTVLRVEVVPQGEMIVRALVDGKPPAADRPGASFRLNPSAIDAATWTWLEDRWQAVDATEPANGPTFRAEWVGERRQADRAVSQEDEALREELRALGYID
ncbi:MAG: sulfatase [Acidobacteriota bacterium]